MIKTYIFSSMFFVINLFTYYFIYYIVCITGSFSSLHFFKYINKQSFFILNKVTLIYATGCLSNIYFLFIREAFFHLKTKVFTDLNIAQGFCTHWIIYYLLYWKSRVWILVEKNCLIFNLKKMRKSVLIKKN